MINKYPYVNIYENKKKNSKLSSQILYGEKFSIIKKYRDWYKVKTEYDKYVGYIKRRKFEEYTYKPTHKVSSLKANVFSRPFKNAKIKMKLSFTSLLQIRSKKGGFLNFDKYWIQKKDVVPLNYKQKIFKNITIFKNVRYKWGGKNSMELIVQDWFNYFINLIIIIAREILDLNLDILKNSNQLKKIQSFFGRVMLPFVYRKKS